MLRAAIAASAVLSASFASAADTCRFTGRTSYGGRLAATSMAQPTGPGTLRIDVALVLDATPLPMFHTHYEMDEISDYDDRGLLRLAVNSRYAVDGGIVRQNWDVFRRGPSGLAAWRIEGKTASRFARDHPGFAAHWPLDRFGAPWIDDFDRVPTERRPDLDLAAFDARVRPPLALAFYWSARLPRTGAVAPVFLAGFKDRKRVDLVVSPAAGPVGNAARYALAAPLVYPELDPRRPSSVRAVFSPDGVERLAFVLHGLTHDAAGTVTALGCDDGR